MRHKSGRSRVPGVVAIRLCFSGCSRKQEGFFGRIVLYFLGLRRLGSFFLTVRNRLAAGQYSWFLQIHGRIELKNRSPLTSCAALISTFVSLFPRGNHRVGVAETSENVAGLFPGGPVPKEWCQDGNAPPRHPDGKRVPLPTH